MAIGPKKTVRRVTTTKLTHNSLGRKFYEIGDKMRSLAQRPLKGRGKGGRKVSLRSGLGYSPGKIGPLLRDPARVKANTKFGQTYRGIQPEQDELVSTSSIRELIKGVQKSGVPSASVLAVMEDVFEETSKLRFPTRWTGFALRNEIMQHPTAKGSGLFAESSRTMKLHNQLDLRRRAEVEHAMSNAALSTNATAKDIAREGMLAAIAFTLNEFVAPITASDVQPFAQGIRGKTKAMLDEQVQARENLKAIFVSFGGKQDPGPIDRTRKWSVRRGQRSVSPPRLPKSTQWSLSAPRPV